MNHAMRDSKVPNQNLTLFEKIMITIAVVVAGSGLYAAFSVLLG